ncbi:MAG: flagellar export chaperone FlgN [Myxococcota bacterium]
MPLLEATVSAFLELEAALLDELGAVKAEREWLRRLDGPRLLQRAEARDAFNARLARLLAAARGRLRDLCVEARADGETLEALECAAPEAGARVRAAVERSKVAARRLDELQRFNRDVTQRALDLVKRLSQRLPVKGAAYSRTGAATSLPRAVTHSRSA